MINPKNIPKDIGEVTIQIHSKGRFKHLKPPSLFNKDVWVCIKEGANASMSFDTTEEALAYVSSHPAFKEEVKDER